MDCRSKRSLEFLLDEDSLNSEVEREIVEEEAMAWSHKATIGGINIAEHIKSTHAKIVAAIILTCAANFKIIVVKPSTKATKAKKNEVTSKAFVTTVQEAKAIEEAIKTPRGRRPLTSMKMRQTLRKRQIL